MNIVIPMVGLGKRFADAGFKNPKPLVLVKNKPIVQHAIESLGIQGNYIFIIRTSDFSEKLKKVLVSVKPDCSIIEIDYLTDGTVSSILLANHLINNNDELVTTNCDQKTEWNSDLFLKKCREPGTDGCVVTYPYNNIIVGEKSPYSFIELDKKGYGTQLEEKKAISDLALCGIHYWKSGKDFISSAEQLIANNDRVNNEFYVAKTYNYLIKEGKKITHFPLQKNEFICLGTPQDVKEYAKITGESDENL